MPFVLFLLVGFLLLLLASGVYVFIVACVRRKEIPWLVEEEIKKTPYAKYAALISNSDSWLKEHSAQDVYVTSDDGLRLHGLWVPVEKPKGTVLLVHGYRSTVLVDFGLALEFYHMLGMNVLLPEHRSHGKSEGKYITFGVKESADMCMWIHWHNQQFGALPTVVSGMSMGASTVMYMADIPLPENVKCLIADCGFTSPYDIISVVFRKTTHLPALLSLKITNILTRLFAGFGLKDKDSRRSLKNSRLPVFIIHGTADDFVPCEMSREAYAVCTDPKQVLYVEGAGHGVSFVVAPEKYAQMLAEFIHKYAGVE